MTPLDPSTIIPVRMFAAQPRSTWRRLVVGGADGALALILNIAAVAGLAVLAVPRTVPKPATQSIAVDLVPEVPGTGSHKQSTGSGQKSGQQTAEGPAKASPADDAKSKSDASTDAPVKAPDAKLPAGDPRAEPSGAVEPAAETTPSPKAPPASAAAPPPLGADHDPTPRLVEAPADPRQAAQQAEKKLAANGETQSADTPKPVERPPPPVPPVLATSASAADPIAEPRTTTDAVAPTPVASAEQQRQAENTAKLAAILPYSQAFLPAINRAPLSGSGTSGSDAYRGAVYGSFRKADDLLADAQAKHLRGQTVVEFSIDDTGALTSIRVAVPSGNPAVDQTAMDIVRRSAPFPPPPPGAQRTFSPAIALGLDDP